MYLSERARAALHEYQYKGVNKSPLYKYALRPLAVYLTSLLPTSIAPNLLTLMGLFAALLSFAVYLGYFLTGASLPNWTFILFAVNLFTYQTLDNMDGQQARRTGTSSPLGQLFDHGCDALNTTISTLLFALCLSLSLSSTVHLLSLAYVVFYLATWDEYFTGELFLGYINGADDVPVATVFLYLLTWYFGPEIWSTPALSSSVASSFPALSFLAEYPKRDLILHMAFFLGTIASFSSVYRVYCHSNSDEDGHGSSNSSSTGQLIGSTTLAGQMTRAKGRTKVVEGEETEEREKDKEREEREREREREEREKEKERVGRGGNHHLISVIPLIIFVTIFFLSFPENKVIREGAKPKGNTLESIIFFCMSGVVFAHIVCHMILAHISRAEFDWRQKVLLIPIALFLVRKTSHLLLTSLSPLSAAITPWEMLISVEVFPVLIAFFAAAGYFGFFVHYVIREITTELGIGCLVIKPQTGA